MAQRLRRDAKSNPKWIALLDWQTRIFSWVLTFSRKFHILVLLHDDSICFNHTELRLGVLGFTLWNYDMVRIRCFMCFALPDESLL